MEGFEDGGGGGGLQACNKLIMLDFGEESK
jgi:hypothetical protein